MLHFVKKGRFGDFSGRGGMSARALSTSSGRSISSSRRKTGKVKPNIEWTTKELDGEGVDRRSSIGGVTTHRKF